MRTVDQVFTAYWCAHCTRVIGVRGEFPPYCAFCGLEAHWKPYPPNRAYLVVAGSKDWEILKVQGIKP